MTVVSFTQQDIQAIDRVLRLINHLDNLFGSSVGRDTVYDTLDALSDRMLVAQGEDTQDHSKVAELRVVRT